ncbi:DeoR family transcriptional regulator [Caballeronia megalochromosomata]|jgi:DeoR family transcriptional regulator, glycerol-3-phosphate regulon repressor|nr:DeoR family transcriptional regulator [Caballeronia megalochromosomata]
MTSDQALNGRQRALLDRVARDGFATIEDLAAQFQVTPQTIRRDVNWLSDQNLLRRYHGGASALTSSENTAYTARQQMYLEEKRRIARLVASEIPNQATLFINLGTTTEEVARALRQHTGLRVITNNLNVANILADESDAELLVAGGTVRARDKGVVGEQAVDFIRMFKVDFGIIGISSIEEDGTLRDFDIAEVRVAQAIVEQSRTVFLVADHSKFGRAALVKLGHLSQIDALFTDAPPPEWMAESLAAADVVVRVAD